jgi:hypothetical protein
MELASAILVIAVPFASPVPFLLLVPVFVVPIFVLPVLFVCIPVRVGLAESPIQFWGVQVDDFQERPTAGARESMALFKCPFWCLLVYRSGFSLPRWMAGYKPTLRVYQIIIQCCTKRVKKSYELRSKQGVAV